VWSLCFCACTSHCTHPPVHSSAIRESLSLTSTPVSRYKRRTPRKVQESMENGTLNHGVDTGSTITIKGILILLMESIDENNDKRVISLGMGDPSAYSCFHTTHVAEQAVVDALQSEKFNGYAPTVGLYQTRR
jgi:hypothetical protein